MKTLIVFLFCLHFCLIRNSKIIRCILKSLNAIRHTLVQLQKENLKSVFWVPEFVYRSPKPSGYVPVYKHIYIKIGEGLVVEISLVFHHSFVFYLQLGCQLDNFEPLLRMQPQLSNVNHFNVLCIIGSL